MDFYLFITIFPGSLPVPGAQEVLHKYSLSRWRKELMTNELIQFILEGHIGDFSLNRF